MKRVEDAEDLIRFDRMVEKVRLQGTEVSPGDVLVYCQCMQHPGVPFLQIVMLLRGCCMAGQQTVTTRCRLSAADSRAEPTRLCLCVCLALPCLQVASKQRQREEAAAAREAGITEGDLEYADADEEAGGPEGDDDLMGDGFTNFVAADEDNEAGVLYYEDELDGDFSESAFLDRDEAEEEEEGEEQGTGEEGS
jgi:hypothetical protein